MTVRQRRPGFTLVELLVVIAIIAILASLTGAAVQKVRERVRDTQCRSDISQLEAAITAFKSKLNAYPPCYGSGPNGSFMLCTSYPITMANSPEVMVLKQMFPRLQETATHAIVDNGLRRPGAAFNSTAPGDIYTTANPILLDPNQCMVFFLSGGPFTNYQGFSTNPLFPFRAPVAGDPSSARLNNGPFWEIQASRMKTPTEFFALNPSLTANRFASDNAISKDQPWFMDPWGRPYLYFCSSNGNDYPFDLAFTHPVTAVQTNVRNAFNMNPWNIDRMDPSVTYNTPIRPFRQATTAGQTMFTNPRSFQIISAGRNNFFGGGAVHTPGTGLYALNKQGGDDYANFQQTPLGVTD